MLNYLLIIVLIFVLFISVAQFLLKKIILFFFGKSTKTTNKHQGYWRNNNSYQNPSKHDKVFGSDEGEYVPYEEINE